MATKFVRGELIKSTKTQGDFHLSHKFGMEIDGVSVNGLHAIENITFEYADGDDGGVHCRPGINHPPQITFRRDFSAQKDWLEWRKKVTAGQTDRRSVSIIFHNDKGEEAKRLNLFHSYPTKWKGPSLNSKASGNAAEEIECTAEEWSFA